MNTESAAEPVTQFPMLDTLRAVGAFAVLVTHVGFWSGSYVWFERWGPVLARLDVGVALFFVLSGFLLSRPWLLASRRRRSVPRTRPYFVKRVVRIFPVYAVTALIALSFLHDNRTLGALDWVSVLTLFNVYENPVLPAGLTHMWSLAAEVAFYAVLPLLMLAAVGRSARFRAVRVVATLVVLVLANVVWIVCATGAFPGVSLHQSAMLWLPGYLTWFAVGIGLALLEVQLWSRTAPAIVRRTTETLASSPGSLWLVAAALLIIVSTPIGGPTLLSAPTAGQALTKNLIYAAIGGLLVFTGIFASSSAGRFHALMSWAPLRRLGHISYGIFCIHLPILHLIIWATDFTMFGGRFFALLALTTVLSVAAAELLYRFVERPALRLRPANTPDPSAATKARATRTE